MSETPPALEKRRQPGRIRAIILAVAVHAAFLALIIFGVTWQSRPEPPVEAELWKDIPATKAAPKAPEPEVEPPKPEPAKPEPPKTEPPKPPEPVKQVEPPKPDPAIAEKAEREKREREKKQKLEKEKRERLEREAEKKKQDDAKKKREEDKRRTEEERAKREAEKAQEAAAAARQSEINKYIASIQARIQGKVTAPTVTGKPQLRIRLHILPGGEVLDFSIETPSGNPVYDAAVERAIRSASPLPVPPADSELFPRFRDLTLNIQHDR